MLEEKLQTAHRKSERRIKQILIGLLASAGLCCFLLIVLSSFDFHPKKEIPPVAIEPITFDNGSLKNQDKSRRSFKEQLLRYENDLEPQLNNIGLERWDEKTLASIQRLKKQAIVAFSAGEYEGALDSLQLATKQAQDTIKKAKQIFSENLDQASSYLSSDLYDEALFHIEAALMVDPSSQEAFAVQKKIKKLPTLLPLLHEASVARTENNLNKEYSFLLQISQLAPERQNVTKRMVEVTDLIAKEQFEEQISSGFAAIDKKQTTKARHHYQQAKKTDPTRKELSMLMNKILVLEKSLRITKAIELAEQAVRRDDWQQAEVYYTTALKDEPNTPKAIEGKTRAEKILRLQSNIQIFINSPYRVADASVQKAANVELSNAQPLENHSFTLKRQVEQLQTLIAQLNRQISVTVASDGKTNVIVRGVGKVGTVTQKEILLKPGYYTFEGSRKGFKSKLLPILIPYDHETYGISVICDERI